LKNLYLSLGLAAAIFTGTAKAETINCTEITAIPMVITVQGVYCLKGNLATGLTVGNMIDIQANNVTIDFNGFKLGGLAGGAGTLAKGVFAQNRKNITIRNGAIRGFFYGISLEQSVAGISSGHLIEDMLLDGNRFEGIQVSGSNIVVRRNRVVNTGSGTSGNQAFGIGVNAARNAVIADNLVSGTSENTTARGIMVINSTLIEVRGNTILDTKDALGTGGIDIRVSSDVTVIGNRILNVTTSADVGISTSSGVNCIGNTIAGFATAFTGCDFAAGNMGPGIP